MRKNYTVTFSELNGRGTNSEHVVSVTRFSSILLQMAIFLCFKIFWWFFEQYWWISSFPPMCVSISVIFAMCLSQSVKTEENNALIVIFSPFYLDMHLKTWSVNRFILFHELYGGCKIKFCNCVSFFLKTRKVFQINSTGFNSEHFELQKKGGKTTKKHNFSWSFCPALKEWTAWM